MRKQTLVLACVGMLAGALLAYRSFCPPVANAVPAIFPPPGKGLPNVIWERAPQLGVNLPDRFAVYRVTKAKAGSDRAQALAQLFDIVAPVDCQAETCVVSTTDRSMWLNGDGTYSYVTQGRWPEAQPDADASFPDQEAVALADSFLRKRALLPEGFTVWQVEPAIAVRGDNLKQQIVGKTVLYHRTLSGLPVYGVSRIAVDIARWQDQLAVVGVSSYYHPVEPYRTVPLRNVDSALADLEAGIGAVDLPDNAKRALAERVSLGYWEDPEPARQPFVQPVYHFEGTAWVGDQPQAFVANVAALDPSVTQRPATPASNSLATPLVPDTVPASAVAFHDGRSTSLDLQARQTVPGALVAALEGSRANVVAFAPVSQIEAKVKS